MTLDDLRAYGANVDDGLARCMNNEGFYLRLVGMVADEKGFGALEQALAAGDLKAGFEAAHALKGVLGNLSLTPLFEPVNEITELLRAETQMDYTELLAKIKAEKERFDAL
ncbi:MAG: Hpt domain-containing protein [Coriobacteriia bacterium]|nr:Hpt domain-containing protein [Coriobacteriia bacterium]